MSKETNSENSTRYQQRSKRKKTNLILNGLIIAVILLIGFVSYSIFHTNDENNADKKQDSNTNIGQEATDDETVNPTNESDETTTEEEDAAVEEEEESENGEIVTEGGSDSNVVKTIENPSWEPIGTTQTGEHAASYSDDSVDWNEQIKALSYATGLDSSNMTVQFLGNNNNDPQKSIGTVSSKDKSEIYRVYIEWVDGSGWKPTKVEELKELIIR
ncbi:DUF1510 family protein [Niallia sp.]|uniref:DUF1510 family protein n=1 Tax=Niallia sp. TaxID=2837523 RepID=UPI0028986E4C|nr:DUF1510 family protein [Niallia sp.]